jgi:hypothetical protein
MSNSCENLPLLGSPPGSLIKNEILSHKIEIIEKAKFYKKNNIFVNE